MSKNMIFCYLALPEEQCRFCQKKAVFGAKSTKIGYTKTALAAEVTNFFTIIFFVA
jgi:hypothetical protein